MTPERILNTLTRWYELLRQIDDTELSFDAEYDLLDAGLEKRQSAMDQIQQLDASLREIAKIKSLGWPNLTEETVERAESLIRRGRSICEQTAESDHQLIEKATEIRAGLLTRRKNNTVAKGYIASTYAARPRPPVIVDDHA